MPAEEPIDKYPAPRRKLSGRISIPVAVLEFDTDGKTIWVHSPTGATVLRIKSKSPIQAHQGCINLVSHCDITVDSVHFCISRDAEGAEEGE